MMRIFTSLCLAVAIVFPIYIITIAVRGTRWQRDKAVQTAIAKGHVVTGRLKKTSGSGGEVPGLQHTRNARLGIYEYEYNGRKYKYKFYAEDHPLTMDLYFLKRPNKAMRKGALINSDVCWPLVYAIVAVAVYLLA